MDGTYGLFPANYGDDKQLHAARLIGRNSIDKSVFWIMSETVQINANGEIAQQGSPFLWLRRLVNGSNILLLESLTCKVAIPLDQGESLTQLCRAVESFMPENFMSAMATMAACIMGASYTSILSHFGCCGVPMLTGPPGSCKSEATKCALLLYGAHETHSRNSQTTPSYVAKKVRHPGTPSLSSPPADAPSWAVSRAPGQEREGQTCMRNLVVTSQVWKRGQYSRTSV